MFPGGDILLRYSSPYSVFFFLLSLYSVLAEADRLAASRQASLFVSTPMVWLRSYVLFGDIFMI